MLALVAGCSSTPSYSAPATAPSSPAVSSPAPAPTRGPATVDVPVIRYPVDGGGAFDFAQTAGPVVGSKGTLLTYRVGVEHGITGVDAATFGDAVELIYADPRSWPATGNWRLRRAGRRTVRLHHLPRHSRDPRRAVR